MSMSQLLSQYGYLAIFVGCLLEGETILLLAGYAAHRGYLAFAMVLAIAFCGATVGDQVFFVIGRRYGTRLLLRFPGIAQRSARVQGLLQRYHGGVIVAVRFMYGLRIVGPMVIGASKVPPWRFVLFNMLGAAIWAVLIGGTGYLFGQTVQWLFADLRRDEEIGLALLVAAAVVFRLVKRARIRSLAALNDHREKSDTSGHI